MRVAITGHRPDKLPLSLEDYLAALSDGLLSLGASFVYEGQAAGIDLLAAEACWVDGIEYEAVVPYEGHRTFNKDPFWQRQWDLGVHHAYTVEVLSDAKKYPGPWVFHNRNKYMVDHADIVLSVWDGTSGGTAACINYAVKKNKAVYNINPVTLERYVLHEVRDS